MDAKDAHSVHMDVMDACCTHYGCLRMLPVYIWMLWMPSVDIMDAKDAPRVHMDVMNACCTHYGC